MPLKFYIWFLQLPPGTQNPDDNTPIDISNPFDVIVYIILPLVLVIGYVLWLRKKKQDKNH